MWGLEHPDTGQSTSIALNPAPVTSTITSRLSRYSYGLSLSVTFDMTKHVIGDYFKDPDTGVDMAGNQMTWLLKRVRQL